MNADRGCHGTAWRWRLELGGTVQGVGFRPFVYRLARECDLGGFVRNSAAGVTVEVEGGGEALERFLARLERDAPPLARIDSLRRTALEPRGESDFRIVPSDAAGRPSVAVLPDIAICAACRREVLDPRDRRHLYPFTSCTSCGPRYSIITAIPYDRPATTHSVFTQCPDCLAEYTAPGDRRFHSQPNACARCGPRLEIHLPGRAGGGSGESRRAEEFPGDQGDVRVLEEAAAILRAGGIVALKGLGGYQLLADARCERAVGELRRRKRRPHKPFAVMVRDLDAAGELAALDTEARRALESPAGPIVLVPGRRGSPLARAVAPGGDATGDGEGAGRAGGSRLPRGEPFVVASNRRVGLFLPTTALHLVLLDGLGFPLVVTSGNVSEEPLVYRDADALERLGTIATAIVTHDRAIARPLDDSVVQRVAPRGGTQVLRLARGGAPLHLAAGKQLPCGLALGGFLKAAVAVSVEDQIVLGQHLGDLDHPLTRAGFQRAVRDLLDLYRLEPEFVACDLHPDYPNVSLLAPELSRLPRVPVQHHHAHVASCLLEQARSGETVLGLSWDGTGYGMDGTIWGCEFLRVRGSACERLGRLRPFLLPGGDRAARELHRSALGLCATAWGPGFLGEPFARGLLGLSEEEARLQARVLERRLGCVFTTSAGRLADAFASLAGLRRRATYEGQAAAELEDAADPECREAYRFALRRCQGLLEVDWEPALEELFADLRSRRALPEIAARFHEGLARAAVELALATGERCVALTGGTFQNRRLSALVARALEERGVEVLLHSRLPPGDGGLAAGQLAVAAELVAAGRRGGEVVTAGSASSTLSAAPVRSVTEV